MPVILQSHHVIEQRTFDKHPLLRILEEAKLVDRDTSSNRLYLPVDDALAEKLKMSPHRGRTDSSYTNVINDDLNEILRQNGGVTALGDPATRQRAAAQVSELQDTLKIALSNRDILATVPDTLGKEAARAVTRGTVANLDQYRLDHADQLRTLRATNPVESEWFGVLHSEQRITQVLNALQTPVNGIDPPHLVAARRQEPLSKEVAARAEFRLAIAHAEDAGRISLSESGAELVRQSLVDDLPGLGLARDSVFQLSTRAPAYKPLSQCGYMTSEFVYGDFSGTTRILRAGSIIGAAIDPVLTAQRSADLLRQDNLPAAQSEVNHLIGRTAGGVAGGTATAVALGASGAGPLVLVAGGAFAGGMAAEKIADLIDNRAIYRQTDRDGTDWRFTGTAWQREAKVDGTADGADNATATGISATYAKSQELNYLATNVSAALTMADAPAPANPFRLSTSPEDRKGLDNADWSRNAETGQWSRSVKTAEVGANDRGVYEQQTATPERAAQLDEQARQVIERNVATSREAIAVRYELAHHANRWSEVGPMPAAVTAALPDPDSLQAHDGNRYRRAAEGTWVSDAGPARGNVIAELDATRETWRAELADHRQSIAALDARPAPTAQDRQRDEMQHMYRSTGTVLAPDWQEAIELASARTRAAHAIPDDALRQLQRNAVGSYGVDSPIAHLQADAQGAYHRVAVTSSEDIRAALGEVRTRGTAAVDDARPAVAAPATSIAENVRATAPATAVDAGSAAPAAAIADHARPVQPAPPIDDIRQPAHPGNGSFRQLASRVDMFEKQNGIEHGPGSERLAASLAALATERQLDPYRLFLQHDERGAITLVQRTRAGEPDSAELRVGIDANALSAQPIAHSSQAHAAALSAHYASMTLPNDAQKDKTERERMSNDIPLASIDRAMFDRIRMGLPPGMSDDHVAQAMLAAKQSQIDSPDRIAQVAAVGDRIVVVGTLLSGAARADVDTAQPAHPLSETAQQTQAFNQQQAAQAQAHAAQRQMDDPGRSAHAR